MTSKLRYLLIFIILLLFAQLLTPIVIKKYSINSLNEPKLKTYRNDEISFLKTFYLMKGSQNFYQSFQIARTNFVDGGVLTADVFTWRLPTIFYIWSIFARNGEQILTLFIFLAFLSLISSYFIARKFASQLMAIFSPIFLLLYLLDGFNQKTSFLFTEWWGLFFYIFGLTFFIYQKKIGAIIFFCLAILTRELFILPLLLLLTNSLFRKNKEGTLSIILPLGIYAFFYLFHQQNIAQILNSNITEFNFFRRIHQFDFKILQRMISFSMRNFVYFGLKTHYLFILIGIFGTLVAAKKQIAGLNILITVISFLLILPLIAVYDNDYWGIVFVPLILISIPLIFTYTKR